MLEVSDAVHETDEEENVPPSKPINGARGINKKN